jgi:glutamyl-Q tRNA(Asp) synthetase
MTSFGERYIGRFAPSPSGPLHFGSLVTALASFARAKSFGGLWIVRMEDIDPAREPAGAAQSILDTLERFGLHADSIEWQSQQIEAHRKHLQRLIDLKVAFPCSCSRSQLAGSAHRGRCSGKHDVQPSWRLLVPERSIEFSDLIQGHHQQPLADIGDFVIWRADGWPSYQLACVSDDARRGMTEIMRGEDLLDSTPRQIYLQQLLGLATPAYAHLPLVLGNDGQKLSKQNLAPSISERDVLTTLRQAWAFLHQRPLACDTVASFVQAAGDEFDFARIQQHPRSRPIA